MNGFEVIDGHQLKGYSHGNYCGVYSDYTFLSTFNYMLLKIHISNRAIPVQFNANFVTKG